MLDGQSFDWSRSITTAVAPVVLISACSLMALAFYNRLAAIVARLRAFQRECLKEQDALQRQRHEGVTDHYRTAHATALVQLQQSQTEGVLKRARLLQMTLTCLLSAVAVLLLSSLSLGLGFPPAGAVLFLLGATLSFAAVIFAIVEIRQALSPIEAESRFVADATANLL